MPQPKPLLAAGHEQVLLGFSFTTDGSGDPLLLTSGSGAVSTITETAGVFTITLAPEFRGIMISCVPAVVDLTFKASYTSYVQATGVITITVGVDDDAIIAGAMASSAVHVIAILCRRSELAPAVSVA